MKISIFGLVATTFLAAVDAASNVTYGRGSPGCGKKVTDIGDERYDPQFNVSGLLRAFRTYTPEHYDKNIPQPLIMAFHGTGKYQPKMAMQSRLSWPDINPNMMVQYMTAVNRRWYGATNTDPWVDDFKFTEMALEHLMNNYCIDVDRVYLVGHTGGGGFANILACNPGFSRHFAAMALMAPTLYRDLDDDYCKNARLPMPILEAHGLQDPTSPYWGLTIKERAIGAIPAIPDWVKRWVRRNKCDPVPHQGYYVSKRIISEKYTCHGTFGFVEHIQVDDQGYEWMTEESELDISPHIMFFLQQHIRPGNLSIPLDSRGLFTTLGGNSSSSGNSTRHKDTFFPRPTNVTGWDHKTATRTSKTSSRFTTSSSRAISTASGHNKTTTSRQDRPAHTSVSTSSTRTFYASMPTYSSTSSTSTRTFYASMPPDSSTSSTSTRTFYASMPPDNSTSSTSTRTFYASMPPDSATSSTSTRTFYASMPADNSTSSTRTFYASMPPDSATSSTSTRTFYASMPPDSATSSTSTRTFYASMPPDSATSSTSTRTFYASMPPDSATSSTSTRTFYASMPPDSATSSTSTRTFYASMPPDSSTSSTRTFYASMPPDSSTSSTRTFYASMPPDNSTSSTRTFYASMPPDSFTSSTSTRTFYASMPPDNSTSSTRTFYASPTNTPRPDNTDEAQACHN
ncbi:hypothetical protein MY11210_006644 [Beauveria gryllotalpidicola]